MTSLILAVGIFFVSIPMHAILHRALVRVGIVTPKTIIVFLVGFGLLGSTVWSLPLPLTAIVLYSALVAAYLLFFLSFFFDAESPSAKILEVVRVHGPLTEKEIIKRFSDEKLFATRLKLLVENGSIRRKRGIYRATRKGRMVTAFFNAYRRLLQWDSGGH